MALETDIRHVAVPRGRPHAIEFRLLHGALYSIFLSSALVGRLMPWSWMSRPADGLSRRSIFAEAKASTDRIMPMVFMG